MEYYLGWNNQLILTIYYVPVQAVEGFRSFSRGNGWLLTATVPPEKHGRRFNGKIPWAFLTQKCRMGMGMGNRYWEKFLREASLIPLLTRFFIFEVVGNGVSEPSTVAQVPTNRRVPSIDTSRVWVGKCVWQGDTSKILSWDRNIRHVATSLERKSWMMTIISF